ncbi:MAG: DUF2829 domain-containing protein [Oscillospiraceae bacterium]|nr:DUF2829 domain-containing protein [Oscillospiraceae bacterium]
MKKQVRSKRKKGLTLHKIRRYCFTFLFGIAYLISAPFMLSQLRNSHKPQAAAVSEEPAETETAPETETTAPELPEQDSELLTETVPEPAEPLPLRFVTSEPSYFDDALFIGDSRTVGLCNYGNLPNADYFCTGGLAAYQILDGETIDGSTLREVLSENEYGKIYVMLGLNEIAFGVEEFGTHIQELYNMIQEEAPDALIFMMANLHITQTFSEESSSISNADLNQANEYIKNLTDGVNSFYIDVNPLFDDENGYLSADYSGDGSHISGYDYARWTDWLCTQTITEESVPDTETLVSFSEAVSALKENHIVTRTAWGNTEIQLRIDSSGTEMQISMKTADDKLVAWKPSQEDLLAEDWIILE